MIYRYKFKNFFSFAEETEVSLAVSQHVPSSDSIGNSEAGARLSKAMAIMGSNASGKTNLLKPLNFLHWFVNDSFQWSVNNQVPLYPHMLSTNKPSEFEVEFDFSGELWKYQLKATTKRVIWEALYKKVSRYSYIFTREWKPKDRSYIIKQKGFGFNKREAEKVRENASLISTAAQYGVELAKAFRSLSIQSNVDLFGRVRTARDSVNGVAKFFKNNPSHKSHMVKLLRAWDLGLTDVEIRQLNVNPEKPEEMKDFLVGIHGNSKGKFELLFLQESSGTQGALILLSKILPVLADGGLVVIDELEADLHPHMLEPILNLFFNKKTNPNNAQIIFTCHAAEVLNLLHKSQVTLVEKDHEHTSHAWRLDEVQGIRADDNLYAKYMAGAYSAVPEV
ncbi:MAG: ATP-binding protein [Sedimenticola sp.]